MLAQWGVGRVGLWVDTNVCAGDMAPVLDDPTGPKMGREVKTPSAARRGRSGYPQTGTGGPHKLSLGAHTIRDFRYLKNPKRAKGALLGHSVSQSDAISIVNPSFGVRHPSIIHCSSIESFLAVQVDVNLFLAQH